MTRVTLGVALVAGLGAGLFGLASGSAASAHPLKGTLTLTVRPALGDPCATNATYPDLADGAGITVQDATGHEIGVGQLGKGHVRGASCVRDLEIASVPVLAEYRLIIADNAPFVVTAEALRASGGVIDLRFGT